MIGIYSGALISPRRKNVPFPQTRRRCVQMLRPFMFLTSYSVMFFLTEFALHTHLNAFGAQTMTALYAAATFINGCGYLLFPLLARTRMPAVDKNLLVHAASALFVLCFWCFAGFYVVCFSAPFMRMAEERNFPELWGCLGRIIKQFVNCADAVSTSALTEVSGARWMFWRNAALVAAMAAWLAFGRRIGVGETYAQETEDEAPTAPQATEDERIAAFAGKYGLSARETEILTMLAAKNAEQTTQELADALGVSRRTCKHRSSAWPSAP